MRHHDYESVKDEFVQGPEISLRALAAKYDMPWSSLTAYANKGQEQGLDWRSERIRFQRSMAEKQLQAITSSVASKKATIMVDALDVIHAAIFKMAQDMQDHWVTDPLDSTHQVFVPGIIITPDSLSKLLDRVLTMTGQPATITESRNFDVNLTPDLPPELARLIADVASERGSASRPVGQAALPGRRKPDPN